MIKNLHSFTMERGARTCWGDFWRGSCYYRGQWVTVESAFLYYTKAEIARLLRQALRDKINKAIAGA